MHGRMIARVLVPVAGLILLMPSMASRAQTAMSRSKQRRVRIYLAKEMKEGDRDDPKNPGNLRPLNRQVNAASPLRATLEVLLAGPTQAEERQGFMDISFGIKLVKVLIKGDTVRADFTMPRGAAFSGDNSPFLFSDAVEFTARQFPGVKKVFVCLDGILDFGSESDKPPRKCPQL